LVPSYIFMFLGYYLSFTLNPIQEAHFIQFYLLIFILTALLPVAFTLLMRSLGLISNLELSNNKERLWPMFVTGLIYALAAVYFYLKIQTNTLIVAILGGMTIAIAITAVITYFWKISAHAVGSAGAWCLVFLLVIKYHDKVLLFPLLGFTLLCGLVLSARLYLGAHNPSQIGAGWLLGFFVSLLLLFI
jgi:membrane-associated phospholipid phosphatase